MASKDEGKDSAAAKDAELHRMMDKMDELTRAGDLDQLKKYMADMQKNFDPDKFKDDDDAKALNMKVEELKEHTIVIDNGQTIHYGTVGNGPVPVLMMPGALGTFKHDFLPQLDKLNASNELTLIAWDPPGYGDSRPPEKQHSFPHLFDYDAECAIAFMKKLGHTKFNLLGWCSGAIGAMVTAALYPDHIDRLCIWGARAKCSGKEYTMTEAIRDTSNWPEWIRTPKELVYGKELFASLQGRWCDAKKIIFEEHGGEYISQQRLTKIKCPTLVIHGDLDALVSKEDPDYLEEHIKQCKVYRFKDGKHNLHHKYTDEFNKVVLEFFSNKA